MTPSSRTQPPTVNAAIVLSSIVLTGLPPGGAAAQFRCQLTSLGPDGSPVLEQLTQPRLQPEWLIKYVHSGPGLLLISIQLRSGHRSEWQEAGRVSLTPKDGLKGARSALVELPITACRFAPDLRVCLQLAQAAVSPIAEMKDVALTVAVQSPKHDVAAIAEVLSLCTRPVTEDHKLMSCISDRPLMTAVEQVIVKDTWNKLLAFHEMLMEMFFERLLYEQPDLEEAFGEAIESVPEIFCGLFDHAVRTLQPHTEKVLREAYRGVPTSPDLHCVTIEEFVSLLTDLGMRSHHWRTTRNIWMWMLGEVPYLEQYERENLGLGRSSAAYKFFTCQILSPALESQETFAEALTVDTVTEMSRCGAALAMNSRAVGTEFYRMLFLNSPEVIQYFGQTDMDHLADHLFKAIAFLIQSLEKGDDALAALRHLAKIHTDFRVPPNVYGAITLPMMEVMRKYYPAFDNQLERGWKVLLKRVVNVLAQPMVRYERLLADAKHWLEIIAAEQQWPDEGKERRWHEIVREVHATGTYTHTYEELAYGAQVAWRNASKCIARVSWRNMIVRDLRHISDPDQMFWECEEHVRMGINGGNMQIVINVFRAKRPKERWGPRIWNSQYLRYAAYEQNGTVLGDRANIKLTRAILRLGWQPPEVRTQFDLLPLVVEVPGQAPRMYEFNKADVMQISIEHPTVPGFRSLGLKWVAIPAISNFRLDVGGIQYGCVPFNGWFMETEIARNLWEEDRYNQAESVAGVLGLDTSSEQSLWRDRAFLELNVAILHSFSKAKVSLVDHQTASKQFLVHDLREKKAGRECPAQWSWVVPALGGSSTSVWHHEMRDFYLSPSYHYAADKWAVLSQETVEVRDPAAVERSRSGVLILYGSETGTAEGMAQRAARQLFHCSPKVLALDDCDPSTLQPGSLILVIVSTFGEGDLPSNAKLFRRRLEELSPGVLTGVSFAVLALGSTIYPQFCAAGILLDNHFSRLGANRSVSLHRGDEIKGQSATFSAWLELVGRILGEDPTSARTAAPQIQVSFLPMGSGSEQIAQVPRRTPGFEARVVANRELLKEIVPGSRSTRLVAFDLGDSGCSYETGDHLYVYPQNTTSEINRLCALLRVEPDAWFVTRMVSVNGSLQEEGSPYPHPAEVRHVLTADLDLTLREPIANLLEVMAAGAESCHEKAQLTAWYEEISRDDETLDGFSPTRSITETYLTVMDLLEAFPSSRVSFSSILELLPRLKPRLYSISSSCLTHPKQVQVTVGVVQVVGAAGNTRQGVCSNFLASLDPIRGDTARIAVRTSTFRPPAELAMPMLMVGPGTGLAPLIGFLQHRGAQLQQMENARTTTDLGEARLYFGCRDSNDYLYQDELEAWRDNGLISHLAVAFSRVAEEKAYVQHLMAEHGLEVWQVLNSPGCHYYICGDAKMASDVFDALMCIAQDEGGLTRGAAVDFFDRMKLEKRYHADVWGITLNFKDSLMKIRDAQYAQGKRWLSTISEPQIEIEAISEDTSHEEHQ